MILAPVGDRNGIWIQNILLQLTLKECTFAPLLFLHRQRPLSFFLSEKYMVGCVKRVYREERSKGNWLPVSPARIAIKHTCANYFPNHV